MQFKPLLLSTFEFKYSRIMNKENIFIGMHIKTVNSQFEYNQRNAVKNAINQFNADGTIATFNLQLT